MLDVEYDYVPPCCSACFVYRVAAGWLAPYVSFSSFGTLLELVVKKKWFCCGGVGCKLVMVLVITTKLYSLRSFSCAFNTEITGQYIYMDMPDFAPR